MHENITKRIERYLNDSHTLFDVGVPTDSNVPMFGYTNPEDSSQKSMLGVIGTDHGQNIVNSNWRYICCHPQCVE